MESFGGIPDLTPLFLGTGGAYAIPAQAEFKISKLCSSETQIPFEYAVEASNSSELVLKLRKIRNYFLQ